jgi:uncharacterized protein (DUF1501 family)
MNRRNFLSLTGTLTGGSLLLPDFLFSYGLQKNLNISDSCVVFIQLNGGNDGLNTFVPFDDPLYKIARPNIALSKDEVIAKNNGMALHPALKGFSDIQQNGDLTIIQNVGYQNPIKSHFRSQEIWQTGSDSNEYLNKGWLGRYLDLEYKVHQPTAGINIDSIDNLALKGQEPNAITVKDPSRFKSKIDTDETVTLSNNPQLDFVRKIADSVHEGAVEIQKALNNSKSEISYPKTVLSKNLEWISRLIKGNLQSKVYYTSLGSFDTHDNQLSLHANKLKDLNDAVFSFYTDLKKANKLQEVTIVIFSEFGRRVKDNGKGTDHGTAAPLFIIGGNNKGNIIGSNPDLKNLNNGDLIHKIDFRSVYATILKNKLKFDPTKIGLKNNPMDNLF